MEQETNAMEMLDLMVRPGFCVKHNTIVKVNQAAQAHLIPLGADVTQLLSTGKEEYAEFHDGCLYLNISVAGIEWGASVSRIGDFHVFILEQDSDQAELKAMALAARELRGPLTSIITTADRLFPMTTEQDNPELREQVARMNRGLFQMLRVISNMSDATRYSSSAGQQTLIDVQAFLDEVFSKAEALVSHAGISLTFQNLRNPVFSLIDSEKLERSVLNILSNAIKFTPKGGTVEAGLTRRGNKLYLSVQDSGAGIPDDLKNTIFSRYQRQPALDDSRFGIGLGMVLIRSTAALHGGTVLMDQPEGKGARITMTLTITQTHPGSVRSKVLKVDYAGERDHGLIELSDTLPVTLYGVKDVN